jgi:hypothetical protein
VPTRHHEGTEMADKYEILMNIAVEIDFVAYVGR